MTQRIRNAMPRRPWPSMPAARWQALAVLLVASMILAGCGWFSSDTSDTEILQQYLPEDWLPLQASEVKGFQEINIDGDADSEWLLFYRYDNTNAAEGGNGPIGGVIYDGQQDADIYDPDTVIPFPFQPLAFFVPYRLLPDWTAGKGQGYLGDTGVTLGVVLEDPNLAQPGELVIFGKGEGQNNTRLTLARWIGPKQGYGITYFQGSYSVTTPGVDPGSATPINSVVTLEAFSDRSKLCEQRTWTRQGNSVSFASSPQTVVFCIGGVPAQPTYPEAVALAWILTGNEDLAVSQEVQDQLRLVLPEESNVQVRTLVYPGPAEISGTGNSAVSEVEVDTALVVDGLPMNVRWRLVEQRPNTETRTTRWRIVSAEQTP